MADDVTDRIRRLADREDIRTLMTHYCFGADRKDFALFRSVFHADSVTIHGAFEGLSLDFAKRAETLLGHFRMTQHLLGTSLITFESDDIAAAETCFHAYHHVLADAPLPRHSPGKEEIWWVGGRYVDRYERRAGVWKIARRMGIHDWEQWEDLNERGFTPHVPPAGIAA
jgi:hypothetical protein